MDGGVAGRVAVVVPRGVPTVGRGDGDDPEGEALVTLAAVGGVADADGLSCADASGAPTSIVARPLEAEVAAVGSDSTTGSLRSNQLATPASPKTTTTAAARTGHREPAPAPLSPPSPAANPSGHGGRDAMLAVPG